jgi:RHS repeat-associated protein
VTVAGNPAVVGADNKFTGGATVASGETTVTIMATDPSGNTRNNTYQLTVSASPASFTFDANGNLTSDGTRTYEWDGADRLVAINQGTRRSEFTYDGEGKRVRIVEKDGTVVLSDQRYVWCHSLLCEERDSSGAAVTKRFFGLGVEEGANKYFYTLDHLTSVREMTDSTGALRARYDYDPYGRVTKVIGDKDAFFTFTGHQRHSASGLILAPYRAYDTTLGQWLSEDPLGYVDGLNLYAYVLADPIGNKDALGLQSGGTGGSTYPEPPQPPMPPPTVPDPKPPIPPRQPPTTTQPPTTPTTPTIIWVTRTITILTAIYVACTTEWVPDVYTDVEAYEASKGRCTCTCLGNADPTWNPTDSRHGNRNVGPVSHSAECREECGWRGFRKNGQPQYQCVK